MQKYQQQVKNLLHELWQQKLNDIDLKLINEILDNPIKYEETQNQKVLATEDSHVELVEFDNNEGFREFRKNQAKKLFY